MKSCPKAAEGLKLVFAGEIIAAAAVVLKWVPILRSVLGILSVIIVLVGLNRAGANHPGYRTAFTIGIAALVVRAVGVFTWGLRGAVLGIASIVLNLAVVLYVIDTTGILAQREDCGELSARGRAVRKLYLACTVAGVVIVLLRRVPLLGALAAGLLGVVLWIVQLAALGLYLIFLNRAVRTLG